MKSDYLFPHACKQVGWALFVPFALIGLFELFGIIPDNLLTTSMPAFIATGEQGLLGQSSFTNDWLDELTTIALSVGFLLIAFSKERDEDELVSNLRMKSLVFAMKTYTVCLILATLLLYFMAYLYFMFINLFLMMVFFIAKFEYELYRFRKENKTENEE